MVEVSTGLHFFVCVLSSLQVAAVYRDPSVGNLINIMIVKLVVVHNEQVSAWVSNAACVPVSKTADVIAGACGRAFSLRGACLKGHCLPCQSQGSRERSPWKTNGAIVRQGATCE